MAKNTTHETVEVKDLTRYERARIIGARALQIGMGAPFLIKLSEKQLEDIAYNPISIAKMELEAGVMPLSIRREVPKPVTEAPKEVKEAKEKSIEELEI